MDRRLLHAQHLLELRRAEEAESILRVHLSEHPEDADALRMIAYARLEQRDPEGAKAFAGQAIAAEPDEAGGHVMLAQALLAGRGNKSLKEAEDVALRAIELEPLDPIGHAVLARIHAQGKRWSEALEAANRGLELDPDDEHCTAIRAHALRNLGRHEEAAITGAEQLARTPDDAWAHLTQGVNCLHAGQYRQARTHFVEALRIDPTLEPARDGLREALRASHWFYRPVLGWFLWLERFSTGKQVLMVFGAYVLFRLASSLSEGDSPLAWIATVATVAYVLFALMTYLGRPLANGMLGLSSEGRHVLDRRERWEGLALSVILLGGGVAVAWMRLSDHRYAAEATIFGLIALLVCVVFAQAGNAAPESRRPMYGFAGAILLAGLALGSSYYAFGEDARRFDDARAGAREITAQLDQLGVDDWREALQELAGKTVDESARVLEERYAQLDEADQERLIQLLNEFVQWASAQDMPAMAAEKKSLEARRSRNQSYLLLLSVAGFWGAQILAGVLASRRERLV